MAHRLSRSAPRAFITALAMALMVTFPKVSGAAGDGQPSNERDVPVGLSPERSAQLDRAVTRGLAWLVAQQRENGGWLGDVGHKQEDGYFIYRTSAQQMKEGSAHLGVSAFAGLALLADGNLPERGRYANTLDRLITYVVARQNEFGYLCDSETRMYSHAFATLFLSQVHGMAMRRAAEVEKGLRAAVEFTVSSQNEAGGWRYSPFTVEADLSVTVCQVQALRAARNAGIEVSSSCIDRVVDYVRASRIESGRREGAFYYKIYGRAARSKTSFAINAAAVTTLHSAGLYDEREYGAALDEVIAEYPEVSGFYSEHYFFWYGNYYAAQALFTEGGPRWRNYWERLSSDLLDRQQADGRWCNSVGPGDVFATAVACLLLRVPAQYLPIFQR